MNEQTDKMEDRFHKEVDCEKYFAQATKKIKSIPNPILEYAPEPMNMIEASRKRLNFVVGNKYTVLERRESQRGGALASHEVRLKDEKGDEIWVDDKYFIPSGQYLMHGDLFNPKAEEKDTLVWEDVPDIRKEAQEKNIPPLFANCDFSEEGNSYNAYKMEELCKLSGTDEEEQKAERKYESRYYNDTCLEGLVKDCGNELMWNLDKCMANIGKVFGEYSSADPDNILDNVRKSYSGRGLSWGDDGDKCLTVDGAKTNIRFDDCAKAVKGLSAIVSMAKAERTVAKMVVSKLKKLF